MTDERERVPASPPMRPLEPVLAVGRAACEAALVLMMLLITIEVALRSIFNYSLQFTDEISAYLLVALTFLAISVSLDEGAVFRVDFVHRRLAARVRGVLEVIFRLVSLAFAVLLDDQVIRLVISSYEREVTAPTLLGTPLYLPQLVMPVGVSLMVLLLVAGTWESLLAVLAPPAGRGRRA